MKRFFLCVLSTLVFVCSCAPESHVIQETVVPETGIVPDALEELQEETKDAEYNKITSTEAEEMMKQEGVLVLDVRTEEEYAQGHIPNSVLVEHDDIPAHIDLLPQDMDATILVYCRTGRRSAEAAQELANMGYTNVNDFGGLITDWHGEVVK